TLADLNGIVERTRRRASKWLGRHGYLEKTPPEERSNEPPAQTALDACAAIAMRPETSHVLGFPESADQTERMRVRPAFGRWGSRRGHGAGRGPRPTRRREAASSGVCNFRTLQTQRERR